MQIAFSCCCSQFLGVQSLFILDNALTQYALYRQKMDWSRLQLYWFQQCHACVLIYQTENQANVIKLSLILSRYHHIVCKIPFQFVFLLLTLMISQAWEKWRGHIAKLDCSAFWVQCSHHQTRDGLRNLLQIMLGNLKNITNATCHWMELFISHLLYMRPFTVVSSDQLTWFISPCCSICLLG